MPPVSNAGERLPASGGSSEVRGLILEPRPFKSQVPAPPASEDSILLEMAQLPPPHLPQRRLGPLGDLPVLVLAELLQLRN